MRNGSFRNHKGRWHIIWRLINQFFNSETEKKALCLMNHQPCLLNTPRRATNLLLVSLVSKRHSKCIFIKTMERRCFQKSYHYLQSTKATLFYSSIPTVMKPHKQMIWNAFHSNSVNCHSCTWHKWLLTWSAQKIQLISVELQAGHPALELISSIEMSKYSV